MAYVAFGERESEADLPGREKDVDVECGAVSGEAPNDPIFGFAFPIPFGAKLVKEISSFWPTRKKQIIF